MKIESTTTTKNEKLDEIASKKKKIQRTFNVTKFWIWLVQKLRTEYSNIFYTQININERQRFERKREIKLNRN